MPTVRPSLFQPTFRNVDGIELTDENRQLYDGFLTAKAGITKRPGLSKQIEATTPTSGGPQITGLHYWPHQDWLIATQQTRLGAILRTAGALTLGSFSSLSATTGSYPSVFATTAENVFFCNGTKIFYRDTSGSNWTIADGDAPTAATHVGFLDDYLLANNGNNKIYHSELGNSTSWTALGFFSAAGNADNVDALHVRNREIYLFGKTSVEIWENDGVTPFSRVPGGFLETGCAAPYSVIVTPDGIYWIETNREIVRFAGRNIEKVSTPLDKDIQGFGVINDAQGWHIRIGGQDFLVWSFPSASRTIVWNRTSDSWSYWGKWDSTGSQYQHWVISAYAYVPDWGLHVVGERDSGYVSLLGLDYENDDTDPIRLYCLTGHLDYGTNKRKRSTCLRLRMKRGAAGTSTTPVMMLRWRDNNRYWSQEKEISLGGQGETDIIIPIDSRGIYRTRQYEFSATDAVDINFLSVEEDIEVLSS